jgi:hypothetical protein
MTGITVPIVYTCRHCGINEREIRVRERTVGEDVVAWMHHVQESVGNDHWQTSPACRSEHCDLKIPLANKDTPIGRAIRQ